MQQILMPEAESLFAMAAAERKKGGRGGGGKRWQMVPIEKKKENDCEPKA